MSSAGLSSIAGKMRHIGTSSQPTIEVHLDGPSHVIRTFSTLDRITGTVSLSSPADTRFDRLEVALVGTVRSLVDKATTISAATGRHEAFQQFLCLQQPLQHHLGDRSRPKQLQAHAPQAVPFTFVVPEHLLPRSCSHRCKSAKLKQHHLQLPPTLGDVEQSGYGSSLLDDLAPSMASVTYGIRVRVFRDRARDGKEIILAAHTRKIRIVPGVEEQPPVTFDDEDEDYRTRQEKSVRKGLLKGKVGRLAMEACQPASFRLPAPSRSLSPPDVSTMVTINLRFDPADATSQPPKLSSLGCKLKPITFFASTPRSDFPARSTVMYDSSQGIVFESLPLAQRCMASVPWEKREANSTRRDSVMSVMGSGAGDVALRTSTANASLPFYTAQLLVPLDLPKTKVLVPTFHSCLVSRVYLLELSLGVSNVTGGCSLKVPVQVSCDSGNTVEITRRASEAAQSMSSDYEDEVLGIRGSTSERSASPDDEAPPEYSTLMPGRLGAASVRDEAPRQLPFGFTAALVR